MRSEIEYIKQKPLANNSFTRGFFISVLSDQDTNLSNFIFLILPLYLNKYRIL
jgi:hypothetical protein